MKKEHHIVLGGNGAVGRAVVAELQKRNKKVTAVDRSGSADLVETRSANLLDRESTQEALEGASHVYICVGLPYSSSVWKRDWPVLVSNVIEACEKQGAKLIFLDNMYMYSSPLPKPFDEKTDQNPSSKKGAVRKEIANQVLAAHKDNKINAVIGRAADFYGPYAVNSRYYIRYIENILQGKSPQFIGNKEATHTYAYTEDIGRALVTLALDESSYGEAWHLPVGEAKTPEEIKKIIADCMQRELSVSYMPKLAMSLMSIFAPMLREVKEMNYQFDEDYVMSDTKFRSKYPDFAATSYEDGFSKMIASFKEGEQ